jgi:hypothetical protein
MATALIISVVVCARVCTIWCSLQTNLAYVAISDDLLQKWEVDRQNLIVISLVPEAIGQTHRDPDWLEASIDELPHLLRWIPPESTVVFCQAMHISQFDSEIEKILSRAAIDTVYLLDVGEGLPVKRFYRPIRARGFAIAKQN